MAPPRSKVSPLGSRSLYSPAVGSSPSSNRCRPRCLRSKSKVPGPRSRKQRADFDLEPRASASSSCCSCWPLRGSSSRPCAAAAAACAASRAGSSPCRRSRRCRRARRACPPGSRCSSSTILCSVRAQRALWSIFRPVLRLCWRRLSVLELRLRALVRPSPPRRPALVRSPRGRVGGSRWWCQRTNSRGKLLNPPNCLEES